MANFSGADTDIAAEERYEDYDEDYVDLDELEDEFEIFRVGPRS